MKKLFLIGGYLLASTGSFAQTVTRQLQDAFQQFESDPQLKHAISSLYVIDGKTRDVIFDKNSQIGLAPASTQKIITAVTAFLLLGKDYRYTTSLSEVNGTIYINGSGDPTLGSWRYNSTADTLILNKWGKAVGALKDKKFITIEAHNGLPQGSTLTIPKGYIWEDIGNYYGSGASMLNWHENQYDISFKSSYTGSFADILSVRPKQDQLDFFNEVRAGESNTGDNAYIYCAPLSKSAYVTGTIPPNKASFSISGAMPDPSYTLGMRLREELIFHGVYIPESAVNRRKNHISNDGAYPNEIPGSTHYSPTLDSIIYWFLKKSINMYGESLIRTIATNRTNKDNIDSCADYLRRFWELNGVSEGELNLYDGSGLSPLNRVTTHAQVVILAFAKKAGWFPYFYNALPEYNGMKMKSGTISDAKAFCGYQKAKDGKEYIFSFIVNNYNGPSSAVVNKMYKVLDLLK